MNNKGQAVLAEYVMIFFLVIAALVAMTTFVHRGLQARIHDARNYMINVAINACDANCLQATGGQIANEYEPYYSQLISDAQRNEVDGSGATTGNAALIGARYMKSTNESSTTSATSNTLPPECAAANPPAYCGNFVLPVASAN